MKTRSSTGNAIDDDRDSDTDESSLTNSSSRQRKIPNKVSDHLEKYGRNGLRKLTHIPHSLKREHESSRDTDQKSSVASNSNEMFANGDNQSVRRSTRQRKFTYDNLNQTWLLASSIPEFSKFEGLFSGDQRSPQEEMGRRRRSRRNHSTGHDMRLGMGADGLDFEDMYSKVKRKRRKTVHAFYTRRISQDGGSMADTEDTEQNGLSDSDTIDDRSDLEGAPAQFPTDMNEESQEGLGPNKYSLRPKKPITDRFQFPIEGLEGSKYSLRPKRPVTDRFQFPIVPVRPRRSTTATLFEASQHHSRPRERDSFKSTAHRNHLYRRKRHAIHKSSSSSSSSDDEIRFEKKKAFSMARARNRCLPLNFIDDDLSKGALRDRMKIGCSLADIDPMSIDKTVSFDHVGGLDKHIRSLKEMILFPLMYPEVFQRFKISPPRGVLFYGQPGTGKTLVARALANECSTGDKRVAFFMRKGADCLSKWVGESERQLRLLFDQAYSMRPSIIFFDEIDGLAPVRSTRQDQIHSSIVSTLLALMDGLDNRGEIVIIGATNRLDAIDPALRRPGRFDRELNFPLPPYNAREKILHIITKDWIPPLSVQLIQELAVSSAGYCGADLKALCSEAALVALRRRYPQIYQSKQKLQLDVETIQVESMDFVNALKKMKPSVQRCSVVSSKPLSVIVKPLMEPMLQNVLQKLFKIFPYFPFTAKKSCDRAKNKTLLPPVAVADSEDSDSCLYFDEVPNNLTHSPRNTTKLSDIKSHLTSLTPIVHRPYFLMSGKQGQGQNILAPAVLHLFETISIHRVDIPALYAITTRAPEEACAQIFHEAQRNVPSVIFLPHIGYWWETLSETVRATFLSLLQDLDPSLPLMLFATSDVPYNQLPTKIQEIFSGCAEQVYCMRNPTLDERKAFFAGLVKEIYKLPHKSSPKAIVEELPVAPPPVFRQLTATELNKVKEREEATLRELRLFLRDILVKLAKDRRFYVFSRPVDPEDVPDYQEVIKNPMDLETMMTKIDQNCYETVAQFLCDVDLICQNALEYNPDRDPSDKIIRHRACTLKDVAHALVLTELDAEFEKICQEIQVARKERGEAPPKYQSKRSQNVPKSTLLATNLSETPNEITKRATVTSPEAEKSEDKKESNESLLSPTRFSKRIREISATSPGSRTGSPSRKVKTFSPPARSVRYMIWRKRKKSPWFGGCKQKLIRRKVTKPMNKRCGRPPKQSPTSKFVKTSEPLLQEAENHDSRATNLQIDIPEERKEMSGTDSSATVLSPKSVLSALDVGPEEADGAREAAVNTPSPARRPCDMLSTPSCSRSGLLRSPPLSGLRRSPQKSGVSPPSRVAVSPVKKTATSPMQIDLIISPARSHCGSEAPLQKIIIDTANLDSFISKLVKVTEDFTVEKLLQLYSSLQQIIYNHRKEVNKKELLKELEKNLDCFVRYKPS